MPQTYIPILPGTIGCSACFSPVRELWIRIMVAVIANSRESDEPLIGGTGGHGFQQRRKLRTVRQPGQRRPQRHVQVRPLAAGRLTHGGGNGLQVVAAALRGLRRGGEKTATGRAHALLFGYPESRWPSEDYIDPGARVLGEHDVRQYGGDKGIH